jgi:hypothetical protein
MMTMMSTRRDMLPPLIFLMTSYGTNFNDGGICIAWRLGEWKNVLFGSQCYLVFLFIPTVFSTMARYCALSLSSNVSFLLESLKVWFHSLNPISSDCTQAQESPIQGLPRGVSLEIVSHYLQIMYNTPPPK